MMKDYEKEVFADFRKYANVVETYPLYDTIVVSEVQLGSESSVPGWFTTWAAFGARQRHSFFKNRTAGVAGEWYSNLNNADTMDFAYKIHSIGVEFTGTPTNEAQYGGVDGSDIIATTIDAISPQWWRTELPRHSSLSLKVQQDVRYESNCMMSPPGYGSRGSMFGFQQVRPTTFGEIPWHVNFTTQGAPVLWNRVGLPEPIGVPRTGSVEVVVELEQWARTTLQGIDGPHTFVMNSLDGASPYPNYYSRYLVRVSLFGERLVQQRAEYHR